MLEDAKLRGRAEARACFRFSRRHLLVHQAFCQFITTGRGSVLVTFHRRCAGRAGPWGCGSDPGRCCRPGTACLSAAPLGWCSPPPASPWQTTFTAADDSRRPAERHGNARLNVWSDVLPAAFPLRLTLRPKSSVRSNSVMCILLYFGS